MKSEPLIRVVYTPDLLLKAMLHTNQDQLPVDVHNITPSLRPVAGFLALKAFITGPQTVSLPF